MSELESQQVGDNWQSPLEAYAGAGRWKILDEAKRQRQDPAYQAQIIAKYLPPLGAQLIPNPQVLEETPEELEARTRAFLTRAGAQKEEIDTVLNGAMKHTEALKAVEKFYASPARTLLLSGGVGCGKTVAAVEWLRIVATERVRYGNAGEFAVDRFSDSAKFIQVHHLARYGYFGDRAEKAFDAATRVKFLVLDDLGAEYSADGWSAQLDSILGYRVSAQFKTVITTNLDADRLSRYGGRITSRLQQAAMFAGTGMESLRR
jgi:DNA replication protein DnaC